MVWTAPMTAVAQDAFTAAQFNTHVRDNLLETAPAVAVSEGGIIATNGPNSVVQRTPANGFVSTGDTLASTSWGDLGAYGPEVTLETGPYAFVYLTSRTNHSSSSGRCQMSFEVSGASSISPASGRSLEVAGNQRNRGSVLVFLHNLTPGVNTFTAKYSTTGATATFDQREISVFPF